MSSPLVSIITPTYNHERFIAQCIESVLAQTYSNWEQIIIDDGSTDTTAQIVREYCDDRIRYYYQDNAGIEALAHTYNRALSLARGELVAILEGDDFWPTHKLSRMVPAFENTSVVLAYGEMREADIDGKPAKRMSRTARIRTKLPERILCNDPQPHAAAYMLTRHGHSLVEASTVVIRRKPLEEIGGFQFVRGRRAVDLPTFIQLTTKGRFWYTTEILGYRRMHSSSTTALYSTEILCASQSWIGRMIADKTFVLSQSESEAVEQSWRNIERANEFVLGRMRLLDRRWKDARLNFRRAVSFSQARISIGAIIGWCISWAHCNLETLFRLAGRAPLRTSKYSQSSDRCYQEVTSLTDHS
jgi:glycosyltransferase involved in cell wall biosynthesis